MLRSGKVVEKPILDPCKEDDESFLKSKEVVEPTTTKEKTEPSPAPPFPHVFTLARKVNHNPEIFKQVKVNFPLLDAIKQVPSYAKFLKDLFTIKRKLNVKKKKAFLAKQVNEIFQNNKTVKYKDPGCPTI